MTKVGQDFVEGACAKQNIYPHRDRLAMNMFSVGLKSRKTTMKRPCAAVYECGDEQTGDVSSSRHAHDVPTQAPLRNKPSAAKALRRSFEQSFDTSASEPMRLMCDVPQSIFDALIEDEVEE